MTSLKKNMAYNVAYQILAIILPLITAPYVSRVLGADGVGTYSYIYSIASYFGLFGMLGISNHGNRSIALSKGDHEKVSQTFWNIYAVQATTTIVALVLYLMFVTCIFTGNKPVAYLLGLFVLSYVLDISWCFFGLEQFVVTVTRNAIIKILTVVGIFLFVRERDDVAIYAAIMSLGTLVSQAYLWLMLKKHISFRKPQWAGVKDAIKPIMMLFIPAIAYSVYKLLDKVMLGSLTTVSEVGLFDNAEKIVNIPSSLITAFGTVMMPRVSTLLAGDAQDAVDRLNAISFRYFTLLVVGAAFGLLGVSSVLAPVYFGSEFVGSAPIICGLGFSLIFVTWANIIRTQYLIPKKLDTTYVVSTIIGACVNLAVNLLLIPRIAGLGAMVGTIAAEFSVFIAQAIIVRREFPVAGYLIQTIPMFFIGAVMAVAVFVVGNLLGESVSTLAIQVLVGGMLYLLLAFSLLLVMKDTTLLNVLHKIRDKKEGR